MADRILVVDDEESMRDVLRRILSAEGYSVSLAENGKRALAILEKERFDFVLCDIRMPEMGGLELLREIMSRKIPGTAIMMSAFGTVQTAVEAMKLGAYDYISKPFMSDEILLTLRKAQERMLEGEGIAGPLRDMQLFPRAAIQMMRVGEDTGTLDLQLENAAAFYGRELSHKLKRLTSLFEPAVIIFMGIVVGFVAVALISAMYGVFNGQNLGG